MRQRVANFLDSHSISNLKVIVALSGGPDSVALLTILNQLKEDYKLEVEAAYLNHSIRSVKENEEDKLLVLSLCNKLSIKLHIKDLPPGHIYSRVKAEGRSLESIAREERYSFFSTLLSENDYLALGHNLDDSLETITMRFFQGSTIDGLKGIDSITKKIIRPLSHIEKREVLKYLSQNSINYNIDKTNLENDFLRNRIRNQLLPLVEEIFPGYKKSLNRLSADIRNTNIFLDNYTANVNWQCKGDLWYTNYSDFKMLPPILRKKQLYKLYNLVFKNREKDLRIPSSFLTPLDKDLDSFTDTILEGFKCRLYKKGQLIIFKEINNRQLFLNIENSGVFRNSRYSFEISRKDNGGLYISGIEYPFTISTPESGTNGAKKIKKLNISPLDYDSIFIIEINNILSGIISPSKIYFNKGKGSGLYLKIGD